MTAQNLLRRSIKRPMVKCFRFFLRLFQCAGRSGNADAQAPMRARNRLGDKQPPGDALSKSTVKKSSVFKRLFCTEGMKTGPQFFNV